MSLRALFLTTVAIYAFTWQPAAVAVADVPFVFDGPGIDPAHYRMTTFATGLNYPVGMAELNDGSILVGVSVGNSLFSSSRGALVRLTDTDGDAVADSQITLTDQVPGGALTSVRVIDDLIFVTGQGRPISIYRMRDQLNEALTLIGRIDLAYPGAWLHPHSTLAVRHSPDNPEAYELYFQVGSDTNFQPTTRTVSLTSDIGIAGDLAGDAIHRLEVRNDGPTGVVAVGLTQIATGLRNAAGMVFQPGTNDLFLEDNGIDGVRDANEPTSADELNRISAEDIGGAAEDFGFPNDYTQYRTNEIIGGQGVQPLVAFQPLPDPQTGAEAEGPNDIAFAPEAFPLPLHGGMFVGMHGKFSLGGIANEENPLVFVDLRDRSYFHVIQNDERSVGHLDGLLSTHDTLYVADISPQGGLSGGTANTGVIYRIQSLIPTIDELSSAVRDGLMEDRFDLNNDGFVDQADRTTWVRTINATSFGDSNLDGRFTSSDLIDIFQAGEYEDETQGNSRWSTGDWDGDGDFRSGDLVLAFQFGQYESSAVAATVVPEPTGGLFGLGIIFFGSITFRRGRK